MSILATFLFILFTFYVAITEHTLFSSSSSVQFITSSSLYLLSSFAPNPTLLPISDGVVVVFKGSNASTVSY